MEMNRFVKYLVALIFFASLAFSIWALFTPELLSNKWPNSATYPNNIVKAGVMIIISIIGIYYYLIKKK